VSAVATIVDTSALWQTVVAALVAGVGIPLVFSVAILAIARFVDLRRDGRSGGAVAAGAVATVALGTCAAAVVLGIVVMTQK
jgi:hypothetical protein